VNQIKQHRRHRNPSEIQELLKRYRESQSSQAEFVRTEGICLATLRNYLKGELSHRAASEGFIEVERADSFPDGEPRHPYRICFSGGVQLEIPSGFSNREVAALLEVISTMGAR
jgi:hypothetical protein